MGQSPSPPSPLGSCHRPTLVGPLTTSVKKNRIPIPPPLDPLDPDSPPPPPLAPWIFLTLFLNLNERRHAPPWPNWPGAPVTHIVVTLGVAREGCWPNRKRGGGCLPPPPSLSEGMKRSERAEQLICMHLLCTVLFPTANANPTCTKRPPPRPSRWGGALIGVEHRLLLKKEGATVFQKKPNEGATKKNGAFCLRE